MAKSGTSWKPGRSGNPGGRIRDEGVARVRELARSHTEAAIGKIVELLGCGEPMVELRAAEAILDRGWGRPNDAATVAALDAGGEDAGGVNVTFSPTASALAALTTEELAGYQVAVRKMAAAVAPPVVAQSEDDDGLDA